MGISALQNILGMVLGKYDNVKLEDRKKKILVIFILVVGRLMKV